MHVRHVGGAAAGRLGQGRAEVRGEPGEGGASLLVGSLLGRVVLPHELVLAAMAHVRGEDVGVPVREILRAASGGPPAARREHQPAGVVGEGTERPPVRLGHRGIDKAALVGTFDTVALEGEVGAAPYLDHATACRLGEVLRQAALHDLDPAVAQDLLDVLRGDGAVAEAVRQEQVGVLPRREAARAEGEDQHAHDDGPGPSGDGHFWPFRPRALMAFA